MKNSSKPLRITKVEKLKRHTLRISFSDDLKRDVDFEPFLNAATHPEIKKFLKPSLFKAFKIVDGDLMWGDFDLLFPIADLYDGVLERKESNRNRRLPKASG